MILILFLLAGLILGLIKKRSFTLCAPNLPNNLILPILAFSIEALFSSDPVYPSWMVLLTAYGLLFWFCISNIRKGTWSMLVFIGTLMNFAVISANGFRMPVLAGTFERIIKAPIMTALSRGEVFGYVLADSHTRLLFLSDIIAINPFGHLFGFASIGDIVMGAGICILAYQIVGSKPLPQPDRNGRIKKNTGEKAHVRQI
jgi:hypothetical protein